METMVCRFAMLGPGNAGKTSLISCFLGDQSGQDFSINNHYRVEAKLRHQNALLGGHYYNFQKDSSFRRTTAGFNTYEFRLYCPKLKRYPIEIVVDDYPGQYLTGDLKTEPSGKRVINAFSACHAIFFLIDAEQLQNGQGNYIRYLVNIYIDAIRRIKETCRNFDAPFVPPQHVVFCLTKADLSPDINAKQLEEMMNCEAYELLATLFANIEGDFQDKDEKLYLSYLITSAYGYNKSRKNNGVDLIAPIAILNVMKVIMDIARCKAKSRVIPEWLDGILDVIDRLDDWLPPKYRLITTSVLATRRIVLELRKDRAKVIEQAMKEEDALKVVVTSMYNKLAEGARNGRQLSEVD